MSDLQALQAQFVLSHLLTCKQAAPVDPALVEALRSLLQENKPGLLAGLSGQDLERLARAEYDTMQKLQVATMDDLLVAVPRSTARLIYCILHQKGAWGHSALLRCLRFAPRVQGLTCFFQTLRKTCHTHSAGQAKEGARDVKPL